MEPHNELVKHGQAFCLAKPGQSYGLYLPTGGSVTVNLPPNATYAAAWWNPANDKDGSFQNRTKVPGGARRLTAPDSGDWALRIVGKRTR